MLSRRPEEALSQLQRPISWAAAAKTNLESENKTHLGHRNLYVLNLPLDVKEDELESLFSRFGRVVHCVILAMLDTQARRRGFIDMDSAASAHAAMQALQGFVWHGYPMEVSYALVQREGTPDSSDENEQNGMQSTSPAVIELKGLLPAATIDQDDVRQLVEPHGCVLHVDFPASLKDVATYSVRVTMSSSRDAHNASKALNGADINAQHLQASHLPSTPFLACSRFDVVKSEQEREGLNKPP